MPKLIRDKTKDFLKKRNPRIVFKRGDEGDRRDLLTAKLLEEVAEYLTANGREAALKELGDMQEVIWALAKMHRIGPTEIAMQAYGKLEARGGFDDLVMMEVEIDEAEEERGTPRTTPRLPTRQYNQDIEGRLGDGQWYSG